MAGPPEQAGRGGRDDNDGRVRLKAGALLHTEGTPALTGNDDWHVTLDPDSRITAEAAYAIQAHNGLNLHIGKRAVVQSLGESSAIEVSGDDLFIINHGVISAEGSPTIALNSVSPSVRRLQNRIVNFGVIRTSGDLSILVSPDATTKTLLENHAGGEIIGDVQLSAGVNTVILHGGSRIVGQIDSWGGKGLKASRLHLRGSDGGAPVVTGWISKFPTIIKDGGGIFTLPAHILDLATLIARDGELKIVGAAAATSAAIIEDGGVIALAAGQHPGGSTLKSPSVSVAAGGTLSGRGFVIGSVTNAGDIRVADAAPGSAGNGKLAITGRLTNSGSIHLGGAAPGNTLVVGAYAGGGTMTLNAKLAGDGARADHLIIDGGAVSGVTQVSIVNRGGRGGVVRGDGAPVVIARNGATTEPGAFTLKGRLVAGPYEYALARGSRDGSDPNSYFLRNKGDGKQAWRQETSLYAALAPMALSYGQAMVGSLHERRGDPSTLVRARGGGFASAAWARIFGRRESMAFGEHGQSFGQDFGGMQAGFDLLRSGGPGEARNHIGVVTGVGRMEGQVKHLDGLRAGRNVADAWSAGLYWTHVDPTGWYLDAMALGTKYDFRASSTGGMHLKSVGGGLIASLEAGRRFALGGGVMIEPQAQIIYQTLSMRRARDGAADVSLRPGGSAAGRLGARLLKSWTTCNGAGSWNMVTWLQANMWREFMSGPGASFSSETGPVIFRTGTAKNWADIRGGVSAQINAGVTLSVDGGVQAGVDRSHKGYDGKVSLNVNW